MIPRLVLAYGCLATVVAFAIHVVATLEARPDLLLREGSAVFWIALFLVHIVVLGLTFARDPAAEALPRWPTVVRPTAASVAAARAIIGGTTLNFAYWVAAHVARRTGDTLSGILTSVYLLSAVYVACHWALRPENIFSWRILGVLRSPLGWLLVPVVRGVGKPSVSIEDWVRGITDCCKSVVDDSSAGRKTDCLELQSLVLDDLESQRCLARYEATLSREGRRSITRFVRAVEGLRCGAADQMKWNALVIEARSVLAIQPIIKVR